METVTPPRSGAGAVGSTGHLGSATRSALFCLLAITPVIALLSAYIVSVPVALLCYAVANSYYKDTHGSDRNILSVARLTSVITVVVSVLSCVLLLTLREPLAGFLTTGSF